MGTRSLTRIFDDDGKTELVCIYRRTDGYPDGHGQELADILAKFKVVNGLGASEDGRKVANGYGCLAAQVIKELKDGPGSIYIYPPKSRDHGEEYEYHVKPEPRPRLTQTEDVYATLGPPPPIMISVFSCYGKKPKKLFECAPAQYKDLCTTVQALQDDA